MRFCKLIKLLKYKIYDYIKYIFFTDYFNIIINNKVKSNEEIC